MASTAPMPPTAEVLRALAAEQTDRGRARRLQWASDGRNLDLAEATAEARYYIRQGTLAFLEAGKRLLYVREKLAGGEWGAYLEREFPGSERTAQRLVAVARAVADHPKLQPIAERSVHKAHALLQLPQEIWDELDRDGTVLGSDADELALKSVHELRSEVQNARDELTLAKEQVGARDEQIKALRATVTDLEYGRFKEYGLIARQIQQLRMAHMAAWGRTLEYISGLQQQADLPDVARVQMGALLDELLQISQLRRLDWREGIPGDESEQLSRLAYVGEGGGDLPDPAEDVQMLFTIGGGGVLGELDLQRLALDHGYSLTPAQIREGLALLVRVGSIREVVDGDTGELRYQPAV